MKSVAVALTPAPVRRHRVHRVRRLLGRLKLRRQDEVRVGRRLVRVVDTRQAPQPPRGLPGVQPFHVPLAAHLHRSRHMHNGEDAVARKDLGDEADALHIGVAVRPGEAEPRGEEAADLVAVEDLHAMSLGLQALSEQAGDGGLARARQSGEPDRGSLSPSRGEVTRRRTRPPRP
ncbi:hypothetical protein GCM10022403_019550 [Streptomyces coacervatus]|uniref:Uncharacterized protein n=1 Tax=Streptomyces coacervatus TaxID=647381 RepID=A0ABP7HCT4_9ACTN